MIFDNAKEEFAVLHPVFGQGDAFRFLGPWIDPKLTMDVAVQKLLFKAKPKLMSLLRLRSYYSKKDMFAQFKMHVLPLLESAGGAIYHAASSLLDQLAHVQHNFCRDMDTSDTAAFIDHNLAPLNMRRDIGLLGMLNKCAHRTAQPALFNLFPRYHVADRSSTRFHQFHSFQILDRCDHRRNACTNSYPAMRI